MTKYEALICDGAVRSGKTSVMSFSFVLWAMRAFNEKNFAICGKSVQSAVRNIIRPLESIIYFQKEGFALKYSSSTHCLKITRGLKTNYFYVFGGKDESSASLIQGLTLAGVLLDEVALMPQSFVEQALARCSVAGARFWFNCNPENPNHWFYKNWIENPKANTLHLHFLMEDNPSLSEEIVERYHRIYTGLFYERFVLGKWVLASGGIYDMFDTTKHVKTQGDKFSRRYVAIDYGTQNPCVFLLFHAGRESGKTYRHIVKEYYYAGRKNVQKTDKQYSADLKIFCQDESVEYIIIDPSAASLIAQLRQDGFKVVPGRNNVLSGISAVSSALADGTLTIDPSCKETIREFGGYVWDEKAIERGEEKPLKIDDHCMDAVRYGIYTDLKLHGNRQNYSR